MAKKKARTRLQKEYLNKASQLDCVTCGRYGVILHHPTTGKGFSQRGADEDIIALCPECHVGKFSIHMDKKNFIKKYGTEAELTEKTRKLIGLLPLANDFF